MKLGDLNEIEDLQWLPPTAIVLLDGGMAAFSRSRGKVFMLRSLPKGALTIYESEIEDIFVSNPLPPGQSPVEWLESWTEEAKWKESLQAWARMLLSPQRSNAVSSRSATLENQNQQGEFHESPCKQTFLQWLYRVGGEQSPQYSHHGGEVESARESAAELETKPEQEMSGELSSKAHNRAELQKSWSGRILTNVKGDSTTPADGGSPRN